MSATNLNPDVQNIPWSYSEVVTYVKPLQGLNKDKIYRFQNSSPTPGTNLLSIFAADIMCNNVFMTSRGVVAQLVKRPSEGWVSATLL